MYNKANYTINHSNNTVIGNPIYFYTIPTTVKNMEGEISFANFLITREGKLILDELGLSPINATVNGDLNFFPSKISPVMGE